MFEKALYLTVQKADESHDSYMARHDAAFEDLLVRKVTIEEVRAYILIRQSLLSSEDRKKIIFESGGALSYDQAKKSIKLLGSKFFLELQSNSKMVPKLKTYDVNQVEDETVMYQEAEEEVDEEVAFQVLLENGDEDACFVSEFEDQICAACQESQELAACFVSYQEARARLRDKAKSRGFWPLAGYKGKGKGRKGKPFMGASNTKGGSGPAGFRRRSLADRIANSTCRRCGQPGHWKRECPMSSSPAGNSLMAKKNDTESFTGISQVEGNGNQDGEHDSDRSGFDVVYELPYTAEVYDEGPPGDNLVVHPTAEVFNAEEADDEAIIDTGASRAVIGSERLKRLVRNVQKLETKMVPSYLDRVLTTPTDPSLQTSTHHEDLPEVLMRPPGINTLTDWGRVKASSGKHASKPFATIYEDDRMYVTQLWNRRGVSSWVRSFQLYCRERRAASQERQRLTRGEDSRNVTPPRVPPTEQTPIQPKAKMSPKAIQGAYPSRQMLEESDWTKVAVETPVPEESKNNKRGMTPPIKPMEMPINQEKVSQIQAQIAILQRELLRILPWRKTVIVERNTGEVKELGPVENWVKLPRLKQIRSTGSAKLSVTVFGTRDELDNPQGAVFRSAEPGGNSGAAGSGIYGVLQHPGVEAAPSGESASGVPNSGSDLQMEDAPELEQLEEGWAPKITPKSGPVYRGLTGVQKGELRKLHNNLGHPDPEKMVKFLTERGAQAEVIEAARDMVCDTCVESQDRRKRSQPSRIHEALDFNDVVGADGAYWTNKNGKTFHFMHFIDEATLYHVGSLSARKVEDQVQTFLNTWVQWAGPCRTLYLDPAGEYVNDTWAAVLQGEGIKVSMTAAEAHWQNGRAEVHGKVVKEILSRMERDRVIETVEEFSQCLRQAFAAKNSLSRVHGFTPEQCLLGKSRHLPGSLVSDDAATSHSLAESSTPEGVRFKESLLRRELARKAFVQADNDSSFRRALLRQSRPGKLEYEAGDWVLYWRRTRGRSRIEVGRWYGPAQVIACQDPKVLWLSHLGRIIRASPEQIRPASLREYAKLPRDTQGLVLDEKPQGRGYIDLGSSGNDSGEADDEEIPAIENNHDPPMSEFSYAPTAPLQSQPEGEQFPVEPTEKSSDGGDVVPQDGRYVPIPDDSDDGLFGDDCLVVSEHVGVWELSLLDYELEKETAEVLCCEPMVFEETLVVSSDRKKRVELSYRDMSRHEQGLFDAAKQKEVNAWLAHGTVKKLAKGSLKPEQIMRCRWLLTWKDPLPGTSEKRAKARLVILGFEDPGVGVVPSDAPTLSKDGRQLLLQQAASRRWCLMNFDISTAFLKGEGDGRPLGIHAPPEIKKALHMKEGDQCSLEGGQLQSMVTRAKVKHLLEANRVLFEGKKHPVCLMIDSRLSHGMELQKDPTGRDVGRLTDKEYGFKHVEGMLAYRSPLRRPIAILSVAI
ncbi:unnamed protein product [Cladocopium goreaui]|uniref:Copia protein n=1 Tax=Cladocopium goreaui TaxID=2562237 RepID=A0A9P1BQH4_9DINO|nr:unnamed protein product [Cladocopium goreaui]